MTALEARALAAEGDRQAARVRALVASVRGVPVAPAAIAQMHALAEAIESEAKVARTEAERLPPEASFPGPLLVLSLSPLLAQALDEIEPAMAARLMLGDRKPPLGVS
jgi:hypothetical protein